MKNSTSAGAVHWLGLCGSLRLGSTNRTLLEAACQLAPSGASLQVYEGVGSLPHYTPDLDREPLPGEVARFRALVRTANGLIVSCPEYAGDMPGSFKNALDWLVGGDEMYGKPVAIWRTSSRGQFTATCLRRVLETLSAQVVSESVFTQLGGARHATAMQLAKDPARAGEIRARLAELVALGQDYLRLGSSPLFGQSR